jgi:D-proline reductase (dithiol) PrdB
MRRHVNDIKALGVACSGVLVGVKTHIWIFEYRESGLSYVRYIERTREYYRAQGYEKPYQWATHDDAPFTPLKKPLAKSRLALISTSEISVKSWDDQRTPLEKGEVGNVYAVPTNTPIEDLYSHSRSFDKHATTLEDVNAYFPVTRLKELAAEGRIGSFAPTAYGLYNAYSQRKTCEVDLPELLRRCQDAEIDVALLTPV